MSKVFKSREVEQALKKKGFKKEPGDHNYFILYVNGVRTSVQTHTSHNGQDINSYLFNQMKKQVHLDTNDFINLIECPLSKEKYIEILKDKNIISRDM